MTVGLKAIGAICRSAVARWVSLSALCIGMGANATVFFNGSFEDPRASSPLVPAAGGYLLVSPTGNALPGWTVTSGTVDWYSSPINYSQGQFLSSDGTYFVDLHGDTVGAIQQTFDVQPFGLYTVSFYLSGNPQGGDAIKDVRVTVAGATQDFSFALPSNPPSSFGAYMQHSFQFWSGPGVSETLAFASLDSLTYSGGPNYFGPLLDNITVTLVPEPCSLGLLVVGALGLVVRRRERERC